MASSPKPPESKIVSLRGGNTPLVNTPEPPPPAPQTSSKPVRFDMPTDHAGLAHCLPLIESVAQLTLQNLPTAEAFAAMPVEDQVTVEAAARGGLARTIQLINQFSRQRRKRQLAISRGYPKPERI